MTARARARASWWFSQVPTIFRKDARWCVILVNVRSERHFKIPIGYFGNCKIPEKITILPTFFCKHLGLTRLTSSVQNCIYNSTRVVSVDCITQLKLVWREWTNKINLTWPGVESWPSLVEHCRFLSTAALKRQVWWSLNDRHVICILLALKEQYPPFLHCWRLKIRKYK